MSGGNKHPLVYLTFPSPHPLLITFRSFLPTIFSPDSNRVAKSRDSQDPFSRRGPRHRSQFFPFFSIFSEGTLEESFEPRAFVWPFFFFRSPFFSSPPPLSGDCRLSGGGKIFPPFYVICHFYRPPRPL